MRVRRLSDELANQIAAGEVVERPASVVKELIENALDAQATRVTVDIEQGGTTLVRVSDDGTGMPREDALLCLERHATSKIARVEDLFRLGTFGFRGEALPSIGSVSRLTLRTRARGEDEGTELEVVAGKTSLPRPSGAAVGTTIEVRDLFLNVPARRKFLKSTATESAHVSEVVLGAALGRPEVTFVLRREGRVVRELLRASDRAERARSVVGGETLAAMRVERGALTIEALLAAPERARTGATGLSLLVNGRPVRDRQLARAVAHAYGSVLEGGRYPVGVVWIDLPPELVDVNVHPQKAEVRFADARGVFDAIARELHPEVAKAFSVPLGASPFAHLGQRAHATSLARRMGAPGPIEPRVPLEVTPPSSSWTEPDRAAAEAPPALLSSENLFGAREERRFYASLRFVGQLRGTFLVCEGDDGMYVLDQHAAAERVTFDRLRRAHGARRLETQRLLVPEIVPLDPRTVALLGEREDEVERLGLSVRAVGDSSVAVHAVPALLAERANAAELVRDLAAELSRSGPRAFGGAVDLVLATMACHGSVRAGDAITGEEVTALLAALDEVDFAGHCPHGRPVVLRMPWPELERSVGR